MCPKFSLLVQHYDFVEFLGTKGTCDDPHSLRIAEIVLSLSGRVYSVCRMSHTYNHNFRNREVKPVELHFHVIRLLGIIHSIKEMMFSQVDRLKLRSMILR
jgi:hypothetical protein